MGEKPQPHSLSVPGPDSVWQSNPICLLVCWGSLLRPLPGFGPCLENAQFSQRRRSELWIIASIFQHNCKIESNNRDEYPLRCLPEVQRWLYTDDCRCSLWIISIFPAFPWCDAITLFSTPLVALLSDRGAVFLFLVHIRAASCCGIDDL